MNTGTAAIFVGVVTAALMPLRWWTCRRAGTLDWRHEGLVIGVLTLMLVGLAAVGSTEAIAQQVVLPLVVSSFGLAMVHYAGRSPSGAMRRLNLRVSGYMAFGLGLLYLVSAALSRPSG